MFWTVVLALFVMPCEWLDFGNFISIETLSRSEDGVSGDNKSDIY